MQAVQNIFVILHLIGMAAIVGGFLEQLRSSSKRVTTVMLWGARAQILTGLLLVGLIYANDGEPNNVKLAVKLSVALAVAAIAEMNAKKTVAVPRAWLLVGALTLVNVAVAVAWG